MRIKPSPSRLIIKLKGNFNDTIKMGNDLDFQIDTSYNPTHHIRIEGEVVGVPERIESNPLTQVYAGLPTPKQYAPAPVRNLYHHAPKWLHTEDTEFDLQEGDKVYFHYNAIDFINNYTENDGTSLLGIDNDGYEYHQMAIEMAHCYIRDGKLKMLNGKVLVKQLNEEKSKIKLSNGITVDGTISKSGLITSLGDKPKYLEGVVHYRGENVLDNLSVIPNDKVMYLKSSEFKNTIEGEEYYVMSQWDIVAKWKNERYIPVSKYVKINLIKEDGFTMPSTTKFKFKDGVISNKGEGCSGDYSIGDVVSFNPSSRYFVKYDDNCIFVREEDIYFKYNQ